MKESMSLAKHQQISKNIKIDYIYYEQLKDGKNLNLEINEFLRTS